MSYTTTRVLTALELLQARKQFSGPELAARLEVNVRTVRRYITVLQDLGFPVETIRGRYGAYRLRPGYKLPPLMFTDDEALAVVLSLLAGRRMGLGIAVPDVEGALAKVERVLPAALRDRVRAVQESVVLAPAALTPTEIPPASATLVSLGGAVQERRRVRLRYRSFGDEDTERAVDPYGLAYRSGRWYVAGYCHLRQGLRVFRLDRILQVALCAETFERPADFDTLAEVERSIARAPWGWQAEVLLHTTLEEARARVPGTLGTVEPTAEGNLLCCAADNLDWLARILIGLGCAFTVRHPPELRDVLRRLAVRLLEAAEAAPSPIE